MAKAECNSVLMSGITAKNADLIGEQYVDNDGSCHLGLSRQPVIVLSATPDVLRNARNTANERGIPTVAP